MKTVKTYPLIGIGAAGLFLVTALGSSAAQGTNQPAQTVAQQAASNGSGTDPMSASGTNANGSNGSGAYATGHPLANSSREGFWGHMNPLARKKWVHRQIDPVKDRVNELDELQAKNASDISDVDARATAGIHRAMSTAQTAYAHAADAATRADQANSVAVAANGKVNQLNGTVSTLDQYQKVTATSVSFQPGRNTLTTRQKASLDQVASSLKSEKGYIVEVQGYSRSGVAPSQAMADAVVRYLVEAHQVPVYRIYRTGMGRDVALAEADGEKPLTNGVRVTILQNSLAAMSNATTGAANPPVNPASQTAGTSNPSSVN